MRQELVSIKTLMEGFSSRLAEVESRVTDLEIKFTESLSAQPQCNAEVETLQSTIYQLKTELNEREQETYSNDLEITGIPEEQGENAGQLFSIVTAKLGVVCAESDIDFVQRVGLRRAPSSETGTNRPRPIIVRVARRNLRNALLQAARARRTLSTEGMQLAAAPTRFYVNERLSRANKMLFFKTRELARSRGWKFVYTSGGRILVRRESGAACFRVRMEEDLEKIFGKK